MSFKRELFKMCLFTAAVLVLWYYTIATVYGAEPVEPNPACIQVHAKDTGRFSSHGSGAYIAPGLVVTCQHNIRDARPDKITVEFSDGEVIKATVLAEYIQQDVAFLKLERVPNKTPMALSTRPLEVGETLSLRGYVSGTYRQATGTLSAKTYGSAAARWRVIAGAASRQGESGGPIVNARGEFAGTLWGSSQSDNMTWFTPASWIVEKVLEVSVPTPDLPIPFDFTETPDDIPLKYGE